MNTNLLFVSSSKSHRLRIRMFRIVRITTIRSGGTNNTRGTNSFRIIRFVSSKLSFWFIVLYFWCIVLCFLVVFLSTEPGMSSSSFVCSHSIDDPSHRDIPIDIMDPCNGYIQAGATKQQSFDTVPYNQAP